MLVVKKRRNKNKDSVEIQMTLEEYYGFEFIAGFTSGGVPYGTTLEEAAEWADIEPISVADDFPF